MDYIKGIKYQVRLKSLKEIEAAGGKVKRLSVSNVQVYHTTGGGGGLGLEKGIIDTYFGTGKTLTVVFVRVALGRNIFIIDNVGSQNAGRTGRQVYGEWFVTPEDILPDKLFDI